MIKKYGLWVTFIFTTIFGTLGIWSGKAQDMSWKGVKTLVTTTFPTVNHIKADSLEQWMANEDTDQPIIFDIREPSEFAISHIQNALQVNPDDMDLTFLRGVDRDAPIVVYCSVGYRSSQMAERIQKAGWTNVVNLEGSIFEWANEGHSVYRDSTVVPEVHPYDKVWGQLLNAEFWKY